MKRELIASALILFVGIVVAGAVAVVPALAQEGNVAKIEFPVAELGNCGSEQACKTYCDDPAHIKACVNFAEQNGLMSRAEAATARKFAEGAFKGPGGCTSRESCESYCDDVSRINECVAFAESQGFLPPEELAEVKQVQSAIARGVVPPACGNKRACESYCRAPAHMQECIAFGEAAGFIKGQELEDAKKVLGAIEKGVTPPPCGGKKECDTYCGEEANFPQCIAFAEAAGFMSKEEVAIAKKTGGKGPGGCRGEECKTYCDNPANQGICFAFAKEHGLLKQEDLQRMEEGKAKFAEGLRQAPPEVAECLKSTVGEEVLNKLATEGGMPPRDLGEKMRACFENFRPRPSEEFREGGPSQGNFQGPPSFGEGFGESQGAFSGPGGCTSPEECRSYCESNPEACANFGGGMIREGREIPRPGEVPHFEDGFQRGQFPACSSPEECKQQFEGRGGFPGGTSEGAFPVPPNNMMPQEFQKQFGDQYRAEFEKQYQQGNMLPAGLSPQYPQGAMPSGVMMPQSPMREFQGAPYPAPGAYPQPTGGTYPSPSAYPSGAESFQQYQQYQGTTGGYPPAPTGASGPPPSGEFNAPPPEFQSAPPPPPSSLGPQTLLGLFLNIFRGE
ncbi:MAG: hypothetical protein HYU81_00905 [Candidatus Brennerbacteria bacterium]|nr:hypothetical protein [Candidatus Brennerbacteria bacterium]